MEALLEFIRSPHAGLLPFPIPSDFEILGWARGKPFGEKPRSKRVPTLRSEPLVLSYRPGKVGKLFSAFLGIEVGRGTESDELSHFPASPLQARFSVFLRVVRVCHFVTP
jgi:hypothetical protein